jgi:hypothetical protein
MSKLTDTLHEMGLHNTLSLLTVCPVKASISYATEHPHAFGHKDHRIVVWVLGKDGKPRSKTLRPHPGGRTAKENRDAHLEAAAAFFQEEIWKGEGSVEWVRDPFTEHGWQWITKDSYEAVMGLVKAHRAAKKAQV